MLLPILVFAAFLSVVGYKVGKSNEKLLKVGEVDPRSGFIWNGRNWERRRALPPGPPGYGPPAVQPSPMNILLAILRQGGTPTHELLGAAYSEAIATGDIQSAQYIMQLAQPVVAGEDVALPADVAPASQEQPGPGPVFDCPIEGVEPEGWASFVGALRTREPTYAGERHVGAYEHNRMRLKQLGVEQLPADEQAQYQALCKDIADYYQRSEKLIRDFQGDVIQINGQAHPVTMSGILGVLKAAGEKGAESFFRNDKERFPRTVDTFLRTNNCF